jgi:hypothetical protein
VYSFISIEHEIQCLIWNYKLDIKLDNLLTRSDIGMIYSDTRLDFKTDLVTLYQENEQYTDECTTADTADTP